MGEPWPWLQTPSREAAWDTLPLPHFQHHPRLSEGEGLCPQKEHLALGRGHLGYPLLLSISQVLRTWVPQQGCPTPLMAETPHMSGAHKRHLASMSSKVLGPGPGSRSLCLMRVLCPELLHPLHRGSRATSWQSPAVSLCRG